MKYPRVELHCHLDGALTPETFYKLSLAHGIIDKSMDQETWRKQNIIREAMPLTECLKRFDLLVSLLQTKEELIEATETLGISMYEQGIRLAEIRFAPQKHTEQKMSQENAIEAVLEGMNHVMKKHPDMIMGIIVCMMNCGPEIDNDADNLETVELAIKFKDKGVVGLDLAGAEGANPTESYRALFEKAHQAHVNITIHAGEVCSADVVKCAMSMHAKRIGHGIHGWQDPLVAKEIMDRKIPLEVNVTSNILANTVDSIQDHPIREMVDQGAIVTISTDDPLLCGVTLQDEYDLLKREFQFTEKDLIQFNLNAARASFCEGKESVIDKLEELLESLK